MSLSSSTCRFLLSHKQELCEWISQVDQRGELNLSQEFKLPSHAVKRRLRTTTMMLVEVLAESFTYLGASDDLEHIPVSFWQALTDWFFEFK
jgi:hypothetical protein